MAVDSALKRCSATLILLPSRGWVYPGVAGVSQAERQAVSYCYSGIAPSVGWSGKVDGISSADISKVLGVARTSISKIVGV